MEQPKEKEEIQIEVSTSRGRAAKKKKPNIPSPSLNEKSMISSPSLNEKSPNYQSQMYFYEARVHQKEVMDLKKTLLLKKIQLIDMKLKKKGMLCMKLWVWQFIALLLIEFTT